MMSFFQTGDVEETKKDEDAVQKSREEVFRPKKDNPYFVKQTNYPLVPDPNYIL